MTIGAQRKLPGEKVVHLVALVGALAILLAPQIVAPCGGRVTFESTGHHCNETFAVVSSLAFLALAATSGSWWVRNAWLQVTFRVILAGLAAAVLVVPRSWALGICRRADMSCHQTELATAIPAVVLLLLAIGLLAGAARRVVRDKADKFLQPDPWDDGEIELTSVAARSAGRQK
jgi:hypothetical protein